MYQPAEEIARRLLANGPCKRCRCWHTPEIACMRRPEDEMADRIAALESRLAAVEAWQKAETDDGR